MSNVIFVGNIAWSMTETTLSEPFKVFGPITSTRIISYRDGRSKGYGYVEFQSPESAQKALSLNATTLEGREIKVDLATPKVEKKKEVVEEAPKTAKPKKAKPTTTLAISSLAPEVTKDDLKALFEPVGEIETLILMMNDKTQESLGFAFVTFKTPESATKALELNSQALKSRPIRLQYRNTTTLFIGNLPFEIQDETLTELFGDCKFSHPRTKDGRGRGVATLRFKDGKEGLEVFEKLAGKEVGGRRLRAQFYPFNNQRNRAQSAK